MTIIESWGGIGSNAYIGYTEAASFIESSIVDFSAWTSASTTERIAAIIEGTRDIDANNFKGERYYYDQMLEAPLTIEPWPEDRTSVTSSDFSIEMNRQQKAFEQANCYQSVWLLRNAGRNQHAEKQLQGIKAYTEKIGPITESFTYRDGSAIIKLSSEAMSTLGPWLSSRKILRA